jgi:hypothetical protein
MVTYLLLLISLILLAGGVLLLGHAIAQLLHPAHPMDKSPSSRTQQQAGQPTPAEKTERRRAA